MEPPPPVGDTADLLVLGMEAMLDRRQRRDWVLVAAWTYIHRASQEVMCPRSIAAWDLFLLWPSLPAAKVM
jgi:hypothetical protein